MALLEPGTVIRDTYEVERFLGEGAFAEVFRVKHRFLGRQALKVFKRVGLGMSDIQDMLGEATLLSRIGHPNIVRVFDANVLETERGPCGYFTMEYVPSGTLDKFWQSYGGSLVPVATAIDLIKQVCRGIAMAHNEKPPIIHRDIKPQNILVGYEADGLRARVSDFGLAKSVNPLTLMATSAGTTAFKPPEAFAVRQGDSCASDVWAIGATLYLLLTDRLPFQAKDSLHSKADAEKARKLVPPSNINPYVSEPIDRVVAKALQLDPASRYSTAGALLEALEQAERESSLPEATHGSADSLASKEVLGGYPGHNQKEGQRLEAAALASKKSGYLVEAADLMEEAFNKMPGLREKYAHSVTLWRRGIAM